MSKNYTIGIDMGGTKMDAVLFDGQRLVADDKLATPKDNLDHLLVMINALVEPLIEKAKTEKARVAGLGLSVAGVNDLGDQKVLVSPNIEIINNTNLPKILEKRLDMPVKMDNDGNCFLRAEMKIGAGKKHQNAYGITIGTGIGGAWWVNDKIYNGSHGADGEPGVMIINNETKIKLEEAYHRLTQNNPEQLANEAYGGDQLAEKIFEEFGEILGLSFANIANLLDPEIFIIGGSVVESSDLFLPQVKKTLREHIQSPLAKRIKVVKGKVNKHAGAIGAAMLVKDC